MNGRKARERRRAAQVESEAPSPAADSQTDPESHPLGSWVGWVQETRRRREAAMAQIMEANRRELLRCTGDTDCPASIHVPSCWATR